MALPILSPRLAPRPRTRAAAALLALLAAVGPSDPVRAEALEILNVSYDPTREFYRDYNALFAKWRAEAGEPPVEIRQSHGGSGGQARAVIDGLGATVVTLALAADIDAIAARSDLIPKDWASRLPHNAAPYASTIVFLVRRGNPKGVRDWGDLTREGVEVITPNPKTSGGARWNVLAAWTWAMRAHGGDETAAKAWLGALFAHVPVLDTGARGATTTFARRGVGDVLLAWENEAMLALDEMPEEGFEIVVPSVSILAEPPVALVEGNIRSQAQLQAARDYLEGLYRPEAQALALRRHFRARDLSAADAELTARFPELELATIADYGGWAAAQARFFADGGIFDQVWGR